MESFIHKGALNRLPTAGSGHRAVFLDRDGTIAKNVGHCRRPEDLELLEGVPSAIRRLNDLEYKVVVITNQSGIARGYFDSETLASINNKMLQDLQQERARIDAIYYCPHHPADNCQCRKPKPYLLFKASMELGIGLSHSFFIGDDPKDIEAGKAAGCKTILVGQNGKPSSATPDFVCSRPDEWLRWILNHG